MRTYSRIFVITALTYRAITSGYIYDLEFKVRGVPCHKDSLKTSFTTFTCDHPTIDGYGIIAEEEGIYLNWYDCLFCGASGRKKVK